MSLWTLFCLSPMFPSDFTRLGQSSHSFASWLRRRDSQVQVQLHVSEFAKLRRPLPKQRTVFGCGGKSVRLNLVCIQLYIVYTIYSNFSITYHFESTQFGPRTGRSFFQAFASAAKSSHFDPLYPMATWGWVDSCDICPPQNFGPQLAQLLSNVRMWFLCLGYLGQKKRVSCGFAQKWWYTPPKGNHCNFR